jgi:hypothetical protein
MCRHDRLKPPSVGGKDKVLQLAGHTGRSQLRDQLFEGLVAVLIDDLVCHRFEIRHRFVDEPGLHVHAFAGVRTIPFVFWRVQPEEVHAHIGHVIGLDVLGNRVGDGNAKTFGSNGGGHTISILRWPRSCGQLSIQSFGLVAC